MAHEDDPERAVRAGLATLRVPGIGKSRLVYEVPRIADAEAELIAWRRARPLP